MQKLSILLTIVLFVLGGQLPEAQAQDKASDKEKVYNTFLTTRLNNAHTVETVRKRHLDIRITHRFGDIAGELGGIQSFFGLDNVTDVRIAAEYGVTNDLTLGLGRSKGVDGAGPTKLVDFYAKYRVLHQRKDGLPISVTLFANAVASHAQASTVASSETSFQNFAHRLSYDFQVLIASKISDRFSIQLMPNFLHRNYVRAGDENNNFALGLATRAHLSKNMAVIIDYYHIFSSYRQQLRNEATGSSQVFYPPLGIGLEIKTGGHVFHLNFSNSPGVLENQYIPYTDKNWLDGQFRMGFNISRPIKL